MFIGQYRVRVDWRRRIQLPQAYLRELSREANEKRHLYFVPGKAPRIYSDKGFTEFLFALFKRLKSTPDAEDHLMAYLVGKQQPARHNRRGQVQLPKKLGGMALFCPGQELMLLGMGTFIEIHSKE